MIKTNSKIITNVQIIEEDFHKDNRGETYTTYSTEWGLPNFCLDKVIKGSKGSLRGFHGDRETWKLFICLSGSIDLVLLDTRMGESYLKTERFKLNSKQKKYILVPPGVANAHQGKSSYILYYKWSEPYNIAKQFTIKWDCVNWAHKPILSERDKNAPPLKKYLKCI